MARYIDFDKIDTEKAYKRNEIYYRDSFKSGVVSTLHLLAKMPSADVVEVVRCKDCKRCYEKRTKRNNQLMRFCMRMDGNEYQVNANDFCSYGTPKERGGEK